MKYQQKLNGKALTKAVVTLISVLIIKLAFMSSAVFAESISVDLRVQGCNVTLVPTSGGRCDDKQCNGASDCICVAANDAVSWMLKSADGTRMNNSDDFKIKFIGKSPLQENCANAFGRSSHQCGLNQSVRVGESYDYEIYLKRCRQGTDPRIIIKANAAR